MQANGRVCSMTSACGSQLKTATDMYDALGVGHVQSRISAMLSSIIWAAKSSAELSETAALALSGAVCEL